VFLFFVRRKKQNAIQKIAARIISTATTTQSNVLFCGSGDDVVPRAPECCKLPAKHNMIWYDSDPELTVRVMFDYLL